MEFWAALIGGVIGGTFTLIAALWAHWFQVKQMNRRELSQECQLLATVIQQDFHVSEQLEKWSIFENHKIELPIAADIRKHSLRMQFWVKRPKDLTTSFMMIREDLRGSACLCNPNSADRWHHEFAKRTEIQERFQHSTIQALAAFPTKGENFFNRKISQAVTKRDKEIKDLFDGKSCDQSIAPDWWKDRKRKTWLDRMVFPETSKLLEGFIRDDAFYATKQQQATIIAEVMRNVPPEPRNYRRTKSLADYITTNEPYFDVDPVDPKRSKQVARAHAKWLTVLAAASMVTAEGYDQENFSLGNATFNSAEFLGGFKKLVDQEIKSHGLAGMLTKEDVVNHQVNFGLDEYRSYEHWMLEHGCSVPTDDPEFYLSAAFYIDNRDTNLGPDQPEVLLAARRPISEIWRVDHESTGNSDNQT